MKFLCAIYFAFLQGVVSYCIYNTSQQAKIHILQLADNSGANERA